MHMKQRAAENKNFIIFYRPLMEPIGGILCWVILYLKLIEIVERVFFKLCLTICITVNDNISYLKSISKFYDLMSLSNLYSSIVTSETAMYKSFGDQRLKERNECLAIVQIYELGGKVDRLLKRLEVQKKENNDFKENSERDL